VTMLPIFLTFLLAAAVCLVLLSLSRFVGPRRPTPVKVQPFECGMEHMDDAHSQLSIKFSVIAMLFIIFDIEVAFLYPWAVRFRQLGLTGLLAIMVFLLILTVGFVYAWRRGALEWN
jgi:NADH-quinone oxidoreductase subunit A